MHPLNSLRGNAPYTPYFIILLCLTPDDFTRQGKIANTQRVIKPRLRLHALASSVYYYSTCARKNVI